MSSFHRIRRSLLGFILSLVLILAVVLTAAYAAGQEIDGPEDAASASAVAEANAIEATASLSVTIFSSPWVVVDSNKPGLEGPSVYVVEARVTNLGPDPATNVAVTLDYNEAVPGWTLLDGEYELRKLDNLAVGDEFYAYWFAQYPATIGASHQYTVTATADEATPVSTSDNFYGNPEAGKTVKTAPFVSSGNSGITFVDSEVVVGEIFTATVDYDLGNNPTGVHFSPVGNPDFDPAASQLLATSVRFYNGVGTAEMIVDDQLYFPQIPQVGGQTAEKAEVSYVFLPRQMATVRLCSYGVVDYSGPPNKYDNDYCDESAGTIVIIDFELYFTMSKQASASTVLQGDQLTYTIDYTNEGAVDLALAWIWDEVETAQVTVMTDTIDPPSDPNESGDDLVAWDIGSIPAFSSGTYTFSVQVDGGGSDLADGTEIVNRAFFGVNRDALPPVAALTSTYTTTVQAPQLVLTKSDDLTVVIPGTAITYTLNVVNNGSAAADHVFITDVLPLGVTYSGGGTGNPAVNGRTLTWGDQGSLIAQGGSLQFQVPAVVDWDVPDGTVLTNTLFATYSNALGHQYQEKSVVDTTSVGAPTLDISKSAAPDPVFSGSLLTYTLAYTNSGQATATNVVITDVVPISTTYQSCSGGTSCGLASGVVTWQLETVPSQSNGSVGFSVLVDPGLPDGSEVANNEYGINSDQSGYVSGGPVTTLVQRSAGFIGGTTFNDANGNGSLDTGETGIGSVAVSLLDATVPNQSTDSSGYYLFRVEQQKWVTVTAEVPAGYFRTTPETVWLENTFLVTKTVDFGYAPDNSPFGVIYGTVFNDLNGNGLQGPGEAGLANVQLTLNDSLTTATDLLGRYAFTATVPGTYKVVETDPAGYFSTTPNEVHVGINPGETVQIDFGDAPASSGFAAVVGTVFEDLDSDGSWDIVEVGISNVTVNFDSSTTKTGKFGGYSFITTNPGQYDVVEEDPIGYFSTTPNEVPVNVVLGSGYFVNFGDVPAELATCSADSYEEDDELNQANDLLVSLDQKHDFCDDAVDWVVFDATNGFEYTMSTASWGQRADTYITLYDSNGNRLAGNDDEEGSSDYSSILVWDARYSGEHYLRVTNRAGLTGFHTDYDISLGVEEKYKIFMPIIPKDPAVSNSRSQLHKLATKPSAPVEPAGVISHSCPDPYEIDDTWQQAMLVEPGVEQKRSFDSNPIFNAADKDFLRFDLQKMGIYTFTIKAAVNTTTEMELYDSDGNSLGVTDDQQIIWSDAPPGRYYLSVSPGPGSTQYGCVDEVGYTLLVESKPVYNIYMPVMSKPD